MRLSGHQLDKCFQSSSSSSTRSLPNNSKEGATPTLRIHQRTKERERERERESGVKECKERERELRLSKRPNKREIGVH